MARISKNMKAARELLEADKLYSLTDAIALVQKLPKAKFDESIDVAVNLGVDPKKADELVRGAVSLPHGTGKTVRVAVFAKGDAAEAAKKAGADIVGDDELLAKVQKDGGLDADRVIATPDMMASLGKVARILGPKGLMPNPKLGSVTPNVGPAVEKAKAGEIQFRVEKNGIIHAGVGRRSFKASDLADNVKTLIDTLNSQKPSGLKTTFMQRVTLSSTMGVGVKVDISSL